MKEKRKCGSPGVQDQLGTQESRGTRADNSRDHCKIFNSRDNLLFLYLVQISNVLIHMRTYCKPEKF